VCVIIAYLNRIHDELQASGILEYIEPEIKEFPHVIVAKQVRSG
jgi:hypothetical protein